MVLQELQNLDGARVIGSNQPSGMRFPSDRANKRAWNSKRISNNRATKTGIIHVHTIILRSAGEKPSVATQPYKIAAIAMALIGQQRLRLSVHIPKLARSVNGSGYKLGAALKEKL